MRPVIGWLRHRLLLQSPLHTPGDGGIATIVWTDVAEVFARLRPLAGREIVDADGVSARVTHEIVIRMRSDIEPRMRFLQGARELDIVAVLDIDGRGRWLRCLCQERRP